MLDTAYVHGNVLTVDEKFTVAQAFGVCGDRFAVVGSDEQVMAACGPDTKVVDLGGKTVVPGLIDSHLHVQGTGALKMEVYVVGCSKEECLARVAAAVAKAKPGEWIVGRGWINDEWADPAFPTKEELDSVSPDNPVCLKRSCGHATWVNSKAFELAGITADTPDPVGGEFLRKADGSLLGVVTDQAQDPFNKAIPPYTREQLQRIALLAQEGFFEVGITSVEDAGSSEEWLEAWEDLYKTGELKLRMYISLRVVGRPSYEELISKTAEYVKYGLRIGQYGHRLTARAYKISLDGSLGARSAWMLDDYDDRPGHKGNGKWTDEQLYNILVEPYKAGFQLWAHGIGDAAVRQGLDVFERLQREFPRPDPRNRIEHSQTIAASDVDRYMELGVIPTYQTVFIRTDKRVADARWGERMKRAYIWRTMIDKGNKIPNGTDSPVESYDPFLSMYCAVARKDEHGLPEGGWHKEEAMTREEALRSYTIWGAYAAFEEHLKGSIEPGKLADFAVLDRDYLTCPEDEIKDIRVLDTVLGGETVYSRQ